MRPARHAGGAVLVFGESLNDSHSIRELLLAENDKLDARRVKALPRPMSLTREARPDAVRQWVAQLESAVRAFRTGGPIAAVVVHRDADGPDTHGVRGEQLRTQIQKIDGLPVVPVQTIEAWWFLFPDAVEAVRPSTWRGRMPRAARDVERIAAPKAELCRITRSKKGTEYSEADSPVIAAHVRRLGLRSLHGCRSDERMATMARSIR